MKLLKISIIVIVSIIGFYSIFLMVSDVNIVAEKLLNQKIEFYLTIFSLVTFGWFILFTRWHLLLKNSNIHIPIKTSFLIYISGFALALIPGEIGDFVKVQILKEQFNIPRTKTSGIIISEWFYTALGLVILSIIGIIYFEISGFIGIAFGVVLSLLICLINSEKLFFRFITITNKIKILSRITEAVPESYEIIKKSTRGKIAIISSLLSISFWLVESTTAYFIIRAFDITKIEFLQIIPMYTSAIILGFVSFLPLGTGVVEGTLTGFLNYYGVDITMALAIIIIIRLFTRWYPIIIGFIALKKNGGFKIN
jgi:glycosyltransferase 2 family protein